MTVLTTHVGMYECLVQLEHQEIQLAAVVVLLYSYFEVSRRVQQAFLGTVHVDKHQLRYMHIHAHSSN